jgi:hypothetical protein
MFDLPLDGEWSDLTATFQIQSFDDVLHLILNEIQVFEKNKCTQTAPCIATSALPTVFATGCLKTFKP